MSEAQRLNYTLYPPIVENPKEWPIYLLSEDRKRFIPEIDEYTFERLAELYPKIGDLIAETMYSERIRIKEEPWKVDPPNDRSFWNKMGQKLFWIKKDDVKRAKSEHNELLKKIIHRYSEEIVGTFSISAFSFARRFLTFFFNRWLNAAAAKNVFNIWSRKHRLYERLRVHGDAEAIRELAKRGTVVVVPTHYSNLDSILIGYTMDSILGLPPTSYGAGLNLYNSGIPAFFMNRLGAYRVDRRKKNPIYLETLKAMSKLSIERGTHSLFFPGGTRSRSGMIETKLKLGLLGTTVEAQRALCEKQSDKKIFIVPVVLGYHYVLEAPHLIEEHLRILGKQQYLTNKSSGVSFREWLKFMWLFFSKNTEIILSFGKPMDVLGNFVDTKGAAFDQHSNEIHIKDYFSINGRVSADIQREAEYTKLLADKIVDRFHKENVVLSSQVVAYTAFTMLKEHNEKLDLFAVLRLPPDDFVFPLENFTAAVGALQQILLELEAKGKMELSEQIRYSTGDLVRDGIQNLGVYHVHKPLTFNKNGDVESDDFKTLYYYHNHLENYGLAKRVNWDLFKIEEVKTVN
ncbi:MAG: hypothetical protein RIS64_2747 [Bacteroidota bacterium]|jgi:glycerol-3-phosphate O-acyltransferase